MRVDASRAVSITVVCGASGSGKSAWVKQRIKKDRRKTLIWDIDDEYAEAGFVRCTSAVEFLTLAQRQKARVCYVAPRERFEFFCDVVFGVGDCIAVAEELAGVTTPGKAPPGWHRLVSRGRKRGIEIIGVTQRPSESDKTIMGNASLFHVCMMARAQDRAYMAREMDVQQDILNGLAPLEWVEKRRGVAGIERGKMRFAR